jgi:hypothetical protein
MIGIKLSFGLECENTNQKEPYKGRYLSTDAARFLLGVSLEATARRFAGLILDFTGDSARSTGNSCENERGFPAILEKILLSTSWKDGKPRQVNAIFLKYIIQ